MTHPLRLSRHFVILTSLSLGAGCGDNAAGTSTATTSSDPGSIGLGQAGAQDFGLFRQILDDGKIPDPDVLDDLGFFAEHKLDFPPATCGGDVCVHALVGQMGNLITGSTCTVVALGLNTPLDPATLERPALDLVLAIDTSGSMDGAPIEAVRTGLTRMLDHLAPTDTVTLVPYAFEGRVTADAVVADESGKVALEAAFADLAAGGNTNIYDGLARAFERAAELRAPGREARVVLLSDGQATTGLVAPARLEGLAAAYARLGIGLTTIGVGEDFDVAVMRGLAEVGAGNFYFLEDPQAVREVFTHEVETFLHPVALDVSIRFATGPGYAARAVYGTHHYEGGASGGAIAIPALFLAGRRSASEPVEDGRRGGGGAIMVELVARSPQVLASLHLGPDELRAVGSVIVTWTDPVTGARRSDTSEATSGNGPLEVPAEGYFTDATVEKAFVMLNLFTGFHMAAELAADNDPGAARGVLEALRDGVEGWLVHHADPDIADDLDYVERFIDILGATAFQTPIARPPEPWPMD